MRFVLHVVHGFAVAAEVVVLVPTAVLVAAALLADGLRAWAGERLDWVWRPSSGRPAHLRGD